jgi:hypothetical protein
VMRSSRQMRVFGHDVVFNVAENTTLLNSVVRCRRHQAPAQVDPQGPRRCVAQGQPCGRANSVVIHSSSSGPKYPK